MHRSFVLVVALCLVSACSGGRDVPVGPTTSLTIPGQRPDEVLALTAVGFGEQGYVAITNFGDGSVSLAGHYLIQRPDFLALEAVRLAPGEALWVLIGRTPTPLPVPTPVAVMPSNGQIGMLSAMGGDLALFATGVLDDPNELLDYVKWGSAPAGSEGVAVRAGVWPEGEAVPTAPETTRMTSPAGADAPDGWTVE